MYIRQYGLCAHTAHIRSRSRQLEKKIKQHMITKLKKFRVKKFRSVTDSNWIEVDNTTCLVGTNESGKTNLLLALWKLNPANDEKIDPLSDYPRKQYVDYAKTYGYEIFISAEFELNSTLASKLSEKTGFHTELTKNIIVSRKYNGEYNYEFAKANLEFISSNELKSYLINFKSGYLESETAGKEEASINQKIGEFISEKERSINPDEKLAKNIIEELKRDVEKFIEENYKRKVNINSYFDRNLHSYLDKSIKAFDEGGISFPEEFNEEVYQSLPKFVYYSDYGNIDSEIYLPHVIDNFERDDLGQREKAKSRSLKVLFEFVNLPPKQILELGKEALPIKVITKDYHGRVQDTSIEDAEDEDIQAVSTKKKEREILLHSASTKLTSDFKDWWKQGNYKFRFQADGNHFRIWVSDEKRHEEIELEGRSKGLQWFFSFFLIFLVESKDSHSNCVLLLDEPGISLHPMAQIDLIRFFNSLSEDNQIVYTTHSPFLVNPDNLGNVYAMFVGENGESIVSPDLRANNKISERSIYPVHAAIGLTVSETLLYGCDPVLVEGISDQIYLQLIKSFVIKEGKFQNDKELVFIPTGGVKGMSPVIKILLGRDNETPYTLLDSDKAGRTKEKQLKNGLYREAPEKVVLISDFLGEGDWEIEDLMPKEDLARLFARAYRSNSGDDFDYIYDKEKPIIDQMEDFAKDNSIELPLGWKVDLAKDFQRIFTRAVGNADSAIKENWIKLLDKLTNKKEE